jgi:hypothetical protein
MKSSYLKYAFIVLMVEALILICSVDSIAKVKITWGSASKSVIDQCGNIIINCIGGYPEICMVEYSDGVYTSIFVHGREILKTTKVVSESITTDSQGNTIYNLQQQ